MMVEYLDKKREVERIRLKEKMFRASLINIEEIEAGEKQIGNDRKQGGSRLRRGMV